MIRFRRKGASLVPDVLDHRATPVFLYYEDGLPEPMNVLKQFAEFVDDVLVGDTCVDDNQRSLIDKLADIMPPVVATKQPLVREAQEHSFCPVCRIKVE